jgi:hypothetical protein
VSGNFAGWLDHRVAGFTQGQSAGELCDRVLWQTMNLIVLSTSSFDQGPGGRHPL